MGDRPDVEVGELHRPHQRRVARRRLDRAVGRLALRFGEHLARPLGSRDPHEGTERAHHTAGREGLQVPLVRPALVARGQGLALGDHRGDLGLGPLAPVLLVELPLHGRRSTPVLEGEIDRLGGFPGNADLLGDARVQRRAGPHHVEQPLVPGEEGPPGHLGAVVVDLEQHAPLLGHDAAAARGLEGLDRRTRGREPERACSGEVEVGVEPPVLADLGEQPVRAPEVGRFVEPVLVDVVERHEPSVLRVPSDEPAAREVVEAVRPGVRLDPGGLESERAERLAHLIVAVPVDVAHPPERLVER